MQRLRLQGPLAIVTCLLALAPPLSADEQPNVKKDVPQEVREDGVEPVEYHHRLLQRYWLAGPDYFAWRHITSPGSRFQPVSDLFRQQLKLPAGQGLVLLQHVPATQSADDATLKRGDILLEINGTPVSDADGLLKLVREAENAEIQFQLMRNGAIVHLPLARTVLLGKEEKRYRIGVHVDEVDDTLRAQLRLADAEGLVVTEVLEDWPAKTSGIKQHDVLLIAGDTKLTDVDSLVRAVQASGGRPLAVTLIRAGEQVVKSVTPKEEAVPSPREVLFWDLDMDDAYGVYMGGDAGMAGYGTGGGDIYDLGIGSATGFAGGAVVNRDDLAGLSKQLAEVLKQVESLRATVEQLRDELDSDSRDE